MPRNSIPSVEQLRIAGLLGVDVRADTEAVAAARIEDAVSPAISAGQPPRPATDRQIAFGEALGLALAGDTLRVASAKIDEELFRRNAVAVESLGLKAGDRVIKRETFVFEGKEHVLEREYVVSSIDPNSLRVWFRGGNGQGAWPTQLDKIGDPVLAGTGEVLRKLDEAISNYVGVLLRRGFTATTHAENAGYGYAERVYVLDHVILKAVYERGLMYLEVGSAGGPERLVEASGFRDLLDPPAQGRWNMGMAAAEFLDAHWSQVYESVRPSNWSSTLQKIETLHRPSGGTN